jgi:hypothetical protein
MRAKALKMLLVAGFAACFVAPVRLLGDRVFFFSLLPACAPPALRAGGILDGGRERTRFR